MVVVGEGRKEGNIKLKQLNEYRRDEDIIGEISASSYQKAG